MSLQNTFKLTRFLFMKNTLKSYTSFLGIYNLLYESQIMFLYYFFFLQTPQKMSVYFFPHQYLLFIIFISFSLGFLLFLFLRKKNHTFKVHFHKFTYSYILCIPHAPPNEHLFTRIKKMQFHITYK